MHPTRVVLLTSIMAPHRIALFDRLADDPDLDLTVVYLSVSDPSRDWDPAIERARFRYRVLRERGRLRRGEGYVHVTTGLFPLLRELEPEVAVVGGWDQPAYAELLALRRPLGIDRLLWWVESNLRDRRTEGRALRRTKGAFLRAADGVIVPGSASASYVAALGADPALTWRAPNAVDNARFAVPATLREERTDPVRFLFAGRLESAKGVATLLDAWSIVPPGARLTIAGNGTLAEPLARRVAAAGTGVDVVGHLDQEALARAYAGADAFVFPSVSDPWGLVVNEAMAAGLPIVASSAPGAVDDLVIDGENGIVVAPHDVAGFARAMSGLAADRERRLEMGRASIERIAWFTPVSWASAMRAAIVGRAA